MNLINFNCKHVQYKHVQCPPIIEHTVMILPNRSISKEHRNYLFIFEDDTVSIMDKGGKITLHPLPAST